MIALMSMGHIGPRLTDVFDKDCRPGGLGNPVPGCKVGE